MAKRSIRPRLLAVLMPLLAVLLMIGSAALAATSPGGVVDDRSGSFSASELAALEEQLSDRRFAYRVIILEEAFPGGEPADGERRFQELAEELLADVPRDAVLITIALKERLVDFRVWLDGPVQSAFREAVGGAFGDYTDTMLDAFAGPAGEGDMAGAIVAAANRIEALVIAPPSPTPGVSRPAPSLNPPAQSQNPPAPGGATPTPTSPGRTAPTPVPTPAPNPPARSLSLTPGQVGLVVGGILIAAAGLVQLLFVLRYRRRHREVLDLRAGFVEELVRMHQQELPLARNYDGEETRGAVQAASAAADRAFDAYRAGTERLGDAEGLARRWRFGSAARLLVPVRESYEQAAAAHAEAQKAYAPVAEAIHGWDEASAQTAANRQSAEGGLGELRGRTGWALARLQERLDAATARQQEAGAAREEDPVRALRLVREADGAFQLIHADLGRLAGQQKAYEARRQDSEKARNEIEQTRTSLGLRFVEEDPVAALNLALQHEADAAQRMPAGDVDGAQEALEAAQAAVVEVRSILARYREAVEQYPVKRQALTEGAGGLAGEQATARAVIDRLTGRYAAEDWEDVRDLPAAMADLEKRIWAGLDEVARLTRPEEQRYLQAYRLQNDWLAELSGLQARLALLVERPGRLEAAEQEARQRLAQAEREWAEAQERSAQLALILPFDLAERWGRVDAELGAVRGLLTARPLPVGRAREEAAGVLDLATGLRRAVDELGRQAVAARERLRQAQLESAGVLGYARFSPPHAAALQRAIGAAEEALTAGRYEQALAEAEAALRSARALVAAYRRHQAEQERRRRAAMMAAAGHFRGGRGSGGGGHFGGGRGSGGGGRFGGGRGSGGGGRW